MYDLIIIGGGPAGVAAAVYAGRKQLKTLLIAESFGGQSTVSNTIGNWIGEVSISGYELAQKLEKHARAQKTVEIKLAERAEKLIEGFVVKTNKAEYTGRAVIVTTGARRRKLNVPGEENLNGKGVSYCSTCDAPFFKNKDVAVIGGGNAGLEAAVDLFAYAKSVYVLNITDALAGDPLTQQKVMNSPKAHIINNAQTLEVLGDTSVQGLKYTDTKTQTHKTLDVQGVFVEIGSVPNSDFVKDFVKLNKHGEIIVDHQLMSTSVPGIFAAGDVTDEMYKQNNTAVGDAVAATLSAYNYILNIEKQSPAAEKHAP